MTPSWNELPVSLENLDAHLKALLRLKIREFVHLSPCFKNLAVVEAGLQSATAPNSFVDERPVLMANVDDCPHRKHEPRSSRRHTRTSIVHLTGVL